jgi:predicted enzyme related to lactoylglutathione lyase
MQMKIKLMTIYVDDQAKALQFYSEVLGFTKKADFSNGGYRWLTVVSPEAPDGAELQLDANTNPAARTFQQARFQQGQPAAMFFVDDAQSEYDRLKSLGVKFTMPPSKVTGSTIAMLDDTCGNLIQIAALDRRQS